MAITYAQLQTRVKSYLGRSSLSVTDLITQAENELNRKLSRLSAMQGVTSLGTLAAGVSQLVYPNSSIDGISRIIRIYRAPTNIEPFEIPYLPEEQFFNQLQATAGPPAFYTSRSEYITFNRVADQNYTDIYAQFTNKLNIAVQTNWVSRNHEELYVYATLKQAAPFIKDDKRIGLWSTFVDDTIGQILQADREIRGEQNGVLIPEITSAIARGRYNIFTG